MWRSFKYVNKQPIADTRREDRQLAKLLQAAEDEGMDAKETRAFFQAQFDASRKLQLDLHDRWSQDEKTLPTTEVPDLRKTLRPKIDDVSMDLVDALAKVQPMLGDEATHELLRRAHLEVLKGGAISEAVRNQAITGWLPK